MDKENVDPSVVVTGTARGIGHAVARGLVASGYQVLGIDLVEHEAIRGGSYRPIVGDAADRNVIGEAVRIASADASLQGYVACAGFARAQATDEVAIDDWEAMLRVNLTGVFVGAQVAAEAMESGGSIVTISSICGREGFGGRAAYCASKAGGEGLVRALAIEWAPRGIRVNAVAPGAISTEMQQEMIASGHASPKAYLRRIPMNRFGEPSEIADAVEYLISTRSSYITGVTLPVDGGWSVGGLNLVD